MASAPSQAEVDDAKAAGITTLQLGEILKLESFSGEEADFENWIFCAEGIWRDLGWSHYTVSCLVEPDETM